MLVFSTTKGVAAVTMALAVSRGYLSYDTRAADYWPEFRPERQGICHGLTTAFLSSRAGCDSRAADTQRLHRSCENIGDVGCTKTRLASGDPTRLSPMGPRPLPDRTDPSHRSSGTDAGKVFHRGDSSTARPRLFHRASNIFRPRPRCAPAGMVRRPDVVPHAHVAPRFALATLNPYSLTARSSKPPGVKGFDFNREDLRNGEMPAGNGHGTARSIARLYGDAATGGSGIGLSSTTLEALKEPGVPPTNGLRTNSYTWILPGRLVS